MVSNLSSLLGTEITWYIIKALAKPRPDLVTLKRFGHFLVILVLYLRTKFITRLAFYGVEKYKSFLSLPIQFHHEPPLHNHNYVISRYRYNMQRKIQNYVHINMQLFFQKTWKCYRNTYIHSDINFIYPEKYEIYIYYKENIFLIVIISNIVFAIN